MEHLLKRMCSWTQMCVLLLLFSHTVLAQQSPPPGKATAETQLSQDSSYILNYLTFLREEEKAHREYLEKLYTTTTVVLGLLVTVGIGLISFFQYKTKSDVRRSVDAIFRATAEKQIQDRIEQFNKEVKQFEDQIKQNIDPLRDKVDVQEDIQRTIQQTVERIADPLRDRVDAVDQGHEKTAAVATPKKKLSHSELLTVIRRALSDQRYTWRSIDRLAKIAGVDTADVLSVIASADGADIQLGNNASGDQIAKLKSRPPQTRPAA